ncbi:hypothetical protein GOBAR_AA31560 [Gossypium barbadense]|uniref:Uncharacterized protein n=1 Tax=Gossypium barbadense TaxID=3634 RepID=A0A2P5WDG7_GOSBA|nr:hypothetical protein GOBAR_AA31560 [Gossypium barbadense]
MLSKFISVLENHFQNTKTALKNQQASIQGLETQIGQLAKLISKRPQEPRQETEISKGKGEVDHNEQKPEISLKEVHEPFSNNSRGPIREERRLQIEELDEWRTHKPRTRDKPKLRQNKLNTFPNQLKVGDRVLLDEVDLHIITAKPN